jgi:tRNA/tmRNA/rRNA uracil-C5-methylase (TrmA/RlmC/RlmD family)
MGSGRARRDEGLHTRLEGEDAGEFKACTRKRRYASEAEAKKAAERSSRRKDAPKIFVYRCEYCGGLHLTHHRPRGGRK